MKRIFLMIVCFASMSVFAQEADSAKVQQLYAAFSENLALSEAQQQPMLDLLYATSAQLVSNRAQKQSNPQVFRQQKRTIMQGMRTEMSSILDAEQMQIFEAAMQQRRAQRQKKGGKKGRSNTGSTQTPQTNSASQMAIDALARSVDFMFDEVLTPTIRNKMDKQ